MFDRPDRKLQCAALEGAARTLGKLHIYRLLSSCEEDFPRAWGVNLSASCELSRAWTVLLQSAFLMCAAINAEELELGFVGDFEPIPNRIILCPGGSKKNGGEFEDGYCSLPALENDFCNLGPLRNVDRARG